MSFAEKLKLLRQRENLSQAELADRLCVSRAAVAKWENENGLPELSNLKAIAAYFKVDLDCLIKEELPLTDAAESAAEQPQFDTFCCKDCSKCAQREALSCPGCKDGPGRAYSGDCPVARCCREHDRPNCWGCSLKNTCSITKNSFQLPHNRLIKLEAARKRRETMQHQAPIFAPVMIILFWLLIGAQVFGLIFEIAALVTDNTLPGQIMDVIVGIAMAMLVLRLKGEDERFRFAGLSFLYSSAVNFLSIFVMQGREGAGLLLLLSLPAAVLNYMAYYKLYIGFSDMMVLFDAELSLSWEKLWKLKIWSFAALVGGVFLVFILRGLALLIVLAGAIGMLVEVIWMLVLLYRSAESIRKVIV